MPQPLNLNPFPGLLQLEIQGCILTPACLAAVGGLKGSLRDLSLSDCLGVGSLGALLTAGRDPNEQWSRLARLRVSCCGCGLEAAQASELVVLQLPPLCATADSKRDPHLLHLS